MYWPTCCLDHRLAELKRRLKYTMNEAGVVPLSPPWGVFDIDERDMVSCNQFDMEVDNGTKESA